MCQSDADVVRHMQQQPNVVAIAQSIHPRHGRHDERPPGLLRKERSRQQLSLDLSRHRLPPLLPSASPPCAQRLARATGQAVGADAGEEQDLADEADMPLEQLLARYGMVLNESSDRPSDKLSDKAPDRPPIGPELSSPDAAAASSRPAASRAPDPQGAAAAAPPAAAPAAAPARPPQPPASATAEPSPVKAAVVKSELPALKDGGNAIGTADDIKAVTPAEPSESDSQRPSNGAAAAGAAVSPEGAPPAKRARVAEPTVLAGVAPAAGATPAADAPAVDAGAAGSLASLLDDMSDEEGGAS